MAFIKLKQIFEQLRQGNLDYPLVSLSWRIPNWLFYYNHSFLLESESPTLVNRSYTKYFKKRITFDDCELLEKIGYSRGLVETRFKSGDKGIIIGQDNDISTVCWATSQKRFLKLSGAILDPGRDGIIFYGAYTRGSDRLKGFFPTVFSELYNSFLAEGRFRAYASIDKYNKSSLNLHRRMNFKIVGETIYIAIFGVNICFYKRWPFSTKRIEFFLQKPPKGLNWI